MRIVLSQLDRPKHARRAKTNRRVLAWQRLPEGQLAGRRHGGQVGGDNCCTASFTRLFLEGGSRPLALRGLGERGKGAQLSVSVDLGADPALHS